MKRKNGGYLIIDLTSTTLVEDLEIAYANDKPILVYDENGKGNFYTLKQEDNKFMLVGVEDKYEVDSEGTITPSTNKPLLYKHYIEAYFNNSAVRGSFEIISFDKTPFTKDNILNYFKENKLNAILSGALKDNPATGIYSGIGSNGTVVNAVGWYFEYSGTSNFVTQLTSCGYLTDSVNQII